MKCVCVRLVATWRRTVEWMRELGFGTVVNSGGRVSVFGLRWCMCAVGRGLEQGLEELGGVMPV